MEFLASEDLTGDMIRFTYGLNSFEVQTENFKFGTGFFRFFWVVTPSPRVSTSK